MWAFNLQLSGVALNYALATALCFTKPTATSTVYFFSAEDGIDAEFSVGTQAGAATLAGTTGKTEKDGSSALIVYDLPLGTDAALKFSDAASNSIEFVVLTPDQGLQLWQGEWSQISRVVLSPLNLVFDSDMLRFYVPAAQSSLTFSITPAPQSVRVGSSVYTPSGSDGVFTQFTVPVTPVKPVDVQHQLLREAGPARKVPIGKAGGVAQAPNDTDFTLAAVWQLSFANFPVSNNGSIVNLLSINYVGDAARLYLNDTLLTDNFYNGRALEVDPDWVSADFFAPSSNITLRILPLSKDAPIYLESWPDFSGDSILKLNSIHVACVQKINVAVNQE